MVWGNRVVAAVAASVVVGALLAGCSGAGDPLETSAVAIGQQAISPNAPTPTPTPITGWSGSIACPAELLQAEKAALPAGASLSVLNPATVNGVPADPNLLAGFVPSCAYQLREAGRVGDEVLFVDMTDSYASVIAERLESDGFSSGAVVSVTDGTKQEFIKGTSLVEIEHLSADGLPVIVVLAA
jgi:hypothetical protein